MNIRELQEENIQLRAKVQFLEEELAALKRLIFGRKSEKYLPDNDGQLSLGFDTDITKSADNQEADSKKTQPEEQTVSFNRTKKQERKESQGHSRSILPAHLPRIQEIIIPENLPEGAKKIGEIITEILEYEKTKVYVKQLIRYKYALPENQGVVIAPMPELPIPKGNAGPGLLSHIAVSKYVDHLPLYRQVQQFKREEITISDSTLGGWITAIGRLLEPMYDKYCKTILQTSYLQMDESPIPVLTHDKPGATHKGYLWAVNSPPKNEVLFLYHKSRAGDLPEEFLKDYRGALQTDAYAAYEQFESKEHITLLACMAHARRKFFDAQKNYPQTADEALKLFGLLYDIERKISGEHFTNEQRYATRQEEALPVLDQLKTFLDSNQKKYLPKSSIEQAIAYTLNLWPRLIRYTENGMYLIDNNRIENTIRPIALGRKNYLFAGSHEAARVTAMFYSFFGTCKLQNINPQDWLCNVLSRIQEYKANRLEELFPQNWKTKNQRTQPLK